MFSPVAKAVQVHLGLDNLHSFENDAIRWKDQNVQKGQIRHVWNGTLEEKEVSKKLSRLLLTSCGKKQPKNI